MTASIDDLEYKIVHKWANDYDKGTCNTYYKNICPEESDTVVGGDVRMVHNNLSNLGHYSSFGYPMEFFYISQGG